MGFSVDLSLRNRVVSSVTAFTIHTVLIIHFRLYRPAKGKKKSHV